MSNGGFSRAFRIWLCERLTSWALDVCPPDYEPSFVEAVLRAYKNGTDGKPLGGG